MIRKILQLRVLKAIVDLSKDTDRVAIKQVHFINDTLFTALTTKEVKQLTEIFFAYPRFKELYAAKRPAKHDLEALGKLPENTLGARYARFMKDYQFSLDWYPPLKEVSPLHFARNRQYETHDILHTITGFGGGANPELGLQAFYVGQNVPNPTAMSTFAAGALNRLRSVNPEGNSLFLEYVTQGYLMGKQAQKVVFRAWEDDFATDITVLRKELGIIPYAEIA
jgi:ubiquinone biosynthesis protein Coq4